MLESIDKAISIKFDNNLMQSVSKAVSVIGGFNNFIKPGDTVLLKPNFNTADPYPASTDPEFLKAVVRLVLRENPKEIVIGDSSTISANTRKVMDDLNIFDLEKIDKKISVLFFEEGSWVKKEIPKGKYLKKVCVPEILDNVDKLILLPCLKTHFIAQFTGALKISIGFMRPSQRFIFHLRNVQEKIADMNTIIRPDLIIMDGRKCFINKGPSEGEIKKPNTILASTSRIAIDIDGIKIIQKFKGNSLEGIIPEE